MVKVNGLIILTEEEDAERIKRIVQEAIQEFKGKEKEVADEIISIDEVRVLFGAKKVGENVVGSPSRRTINDWIRRKVNPLPCVSRHPSKFLERVAYEWFIKEKNTYQY